MTRPQWHLVALMVLVGLLGCASEPDRVASRAASDERPAPLFDNLGDHHHAVSTDSPLAQRYFDQGLILAYGFNHHEAIRSFKAAAKVDPDLAMAYWGIALAHGPNINAPMTDEAVPQAYAALQKAIALAPKASEKEQAYIRALATRYSPEPVADRSELDQAYADTMREVARQYPDDLDAATLYAEAIMNTTPWEYWQPNGQPKPGTEDLVGTLESVMARNPNHPGANHFYIHAVEASPQPERGLAAADRLGDLVPGAGHLVHMPAHIYLRVGQYHDASAANERAIASDERYIAQCRAQGFYPAMYYSHNVHFLWYALMMEGRSREALAAGRKTAAALSEEDIHAIPFLEWLKAVPLYTLVRFGQWDQILREPEPARDSLYERAMWHYARGMAHLGKGQVEQAQQEADTLHAIAQSEEVESLEIDFFPGASLVRIADAVLAAELAGRRGETDTMVERFQAAVAMQDQLPYMEPPYWYYPVRQSLGAALLGADRSEAAEAVYREDLERHPRNGWSLFGLRESLKAQGKDEQAEEVDRQFQQAWEHADVAPTVARL